MSSLATSTPNYRYEVLPLKKGRVLYVPNFLSKVEADTLFSFTSGTNVKGEPNIPFKEHVIRVYGREVNQPRLSCMLGRDYKYSGKILRADGPIPKELMAVVEKLQRFFEEIGEQQAVLREDCSAINGVLCNQYNDGTHYISPHSDDERDMVKDSYICGLSLGATRHFDLRDKSGEEERYRIDLTHGSMICMGPGVQENYTHGVPVEKTVKKMRQNFTFRWMTN